MNHVDAGGYVLLENRTVSRKTPRDGKLEILDSTAARLAALGQEFTVVSAGRKDTARLETMTCECGKGGGKGHVHRFVESPLLQAFIEGTELRLELDESDGVLRVEVAEA